MGDVRLVDVDGDHHLDVVSAAGSGPPQVNGIVVLLNP
jgi:hypothetical protein